MSITKPSLTVLATVAATLSGVAVAMIFFVAPEDADQGLSQKIFYVHVPIALTAYATREDRLRILGAGFQLHLTKPIDAEELIASVVNVATTLGKI